MDMLLRSINIVNLADIFRRHHGASPAPYLIAKERKALAREYAVENGIWEDLDNHFRPDQPIPVIKRSVYRNYRRIGDRTVPQARAGERMRELRRAFLALWLEHPKADLDYLQDLLWAYCDDWTWVMAAHEGRAIDLGAATLGATLAEILYVLRHQLEEEVTKRVSHEIERRIFDPFFNYHHADTWKSVRHNWNHVCNGEIIRTALYQIEDPLVLANMVHGAIQNLTYAIDGFTDDGGCVEGPGYWDYGFGHYLAVAEALFFRTGGEINLLADEKIRRICKYPLAVNIEGPLRATFADASQGYMPARLALIINSFYPMENLYHLCERNEDGTLHLRDVHELATYNGEKASGEPDSSDYLLPELGLVKLRGDEGPGQLTLMALAGNNGVNHNHNDIGSFMVYKHKQIFFVDPGGPVYSRATFSTSRYESVFCNSFGHSVPIIGGRPQEAGREYYGTMRVANLNGMNGEHMKCVTIDMTHAYPEGTVKNLVRSFTLDTQANRLWLQDAYLFEEVPDSIEEAFITFHPVEVQSGGTSVRIGDEEHGVILSAPDVVGHFNVTVLLEESKEGRTSEIIRRVTFEPHEVLPAMSIRFLIE